VSGDVYYNENDPNCAQWLRNLCADGLIPAGDVDDRDIRDVRPSDVSGYVQCHFFAGIGIWPLALRMAGWPDGRRIWTGSCPCGPFSQSGKRLGFADDRHLWPAWHWLIRQCRPVSLAGEQVESVDGRIWLDVVSADLENCGYTCGAAVLPSAGVGAPNLRHRFFWVADADGYGCGKQRDQRDERGADADGCRPHGRLADAPGKRLDRSERGGASQGSGVGSAHGGEHGVFGEASGGGENIRQPALGDEASGGRRAMERPERFRGCASIVGTGATARVGDAERAGLPDAGAPHLRGTGRRQERGEPEPSGRALHPWRELEWIECRDGKRRPTQSPYVRLVARDTAGMVRLRSTANAHEEVNGTADATGPREELSGVWGAASAQKVGEPSSRRPIELCSSEVLQQGLHGGGDGGSDEGCPLAHDEPRPIRESRKRNVRGVRESAIEGAALCASHGSRSDEQQPAKLHDIVRLLSPSLSLAELHGERHAASELRALRAAIYQAGSVLYASHPVGEVWRRLDNESKGLIRLGFDTRDWRLVNTFPLARRVPGDVLKLRAIGNAINPYPAAEVIRAWMACRP